MFERLSKRELEIIDMLAHGFSAQDIEKWFSIKRTTFKSHVNNIYAKFADVLETCKRDSSMHSKKTVIILLYLRYEGVLDKDWYIRI